MDISSNSKKKLSHSLYSLFCRSSYSLFTLDFLPKTFDSPESSRDRRFEAKQIDASLTSNTRYSFIRSVKLSSLCSVAHISSRDLYFYGCDSCKRGYASQISRVNMWKPRSRALFRWFSVSPPCEKVGIDGFKPLATAKQVSEIIGLVRGGANGWESKLNFMNVRLSIASAVEVIQVLNFERVSAQHFFNWVRHYQPEFSWNSDLCNLMIDNCGRLDHFEEMHSLLNDFREGGVHLTEKAFGFLPIMISSEASTMKSICKVIELLNEVGGCCHASGILSLIQMLSILGSFEMAKYVLNIIEKKASYYNILIREMCRRCDFEGARGMLGEMRQIGFVPQAQNYNCILSYLYKYHKTAEACNLIEEMQERGCPPNALTFEIFICYFWRIGKLDLAIDFLDRMVSKGIEPRFTTHAAFVKGYFNFGQYQKTSEYVSSSCSKHKWASNMMYSLLASLHQRRGNLVIAQGILSTMIRKGLRPDYSVYARVLKHLHNSGKEDLSTNLKGSFSNLSLQSTRDAEIL